MQLGSIGTQYRSLLVFRVACVRVFIVLKLESRTIVAWVLSGSIAAPLSHGCSSGEGTAVIIVRVPYPHTWRFDIVVQAHLTVQLQVPDQGGPEVG